MDPRDRPMEAAQRRDPGTQGPRDRTVAPLVVATGSARFVVLAASVSRHSPFPCSAPLSLFLHRILLMRNPGNPNAVSLTIVARSRLDFWSPRLKFGASLEPKVGVWSLQERNAQSLSPERCERLPVMEDGSSGCLVGAHFV